jgi:hypothetical protein
MPVALRGSLLSHAYAEHRLARDFAGRLGEGSRENGRSSIRRVWRRAVLGLGPSSGATAVMDLVVVPVLTALGMEVTDIRRREQGFCTARAERLGTVAAALLATPWGASLDRTRRDGVAHADATGARWAVVSDGRAIRLVDPARAFARTYLELDMALSVDDDRSFDTFWALLRGEALASSLDNPRALVQEVLEAAERHALGVCRSLREGVLDALSALLQGSVDRAVTTRSKRARPAVLAILHEECLTIVYRLLFLLFAEARSLVPLWHPVFREGYSVEALCRLAEDPERPPGLWDSLQAMCRLAHRGCRAGDLIVTPFNGRLFAPGGTASADRRGISDDMVRDALVALASRPEGTAGRRRVCYADLGVEQLGVVYESLLDYRPTVANAEPSASQRASRPALALEAGSGHRKATGSFYTPRSITEYLVRRTLHPIVTGQSAEGILDLRIVDPAMGSGAFLVAACRYLAAAYEGALLAEGGCSARELDAETRAGFRRLVAQRCLYGVDLNPMAVQLACLSLWLATLAAERPLSFLDHRLRVGNSLVGASLADMARQPPGPRASQAGSRRLPLFASDEIVAMLRETVPGRRRLEMERDETVDVVRGKEQALARLASTGSPLSRWKQLADVWCSAWFWTGGDSAPPGKAFPDLTDAVLGRTSALPPALSAAWLQRAADIGREQRFFHWTLEFPEVFYEEDGRPRRNGGFDAVLGNPPWDMLRADDAASTTPVRNMGRFVRSAGIYQASGSGHVNLYQLFVERSLGLLRSGGRLGLVVPSGLAVDHGGSDLRRELLHRADTDTILGFDNRGGIFPVHRSLRFLLWTATSGRPTEAIQCRFGEDDPSTLDRIPDAGDEGGAPASILVTRAFVERYSPRQAVIPHLRSALDLRIAEKIACTVPSLGDADWSIRFSRELNATDDRPRMSRAGGGLPVLEGKHLSPFAVDAGGASWFVRMDEATRLVDPARTFMRERLAYRDVASSTNALTLIAAILPRSVVTTHTVFCLATDLEANLQRYLCGMLNSYVANYLVRLRTTTHVTAAAMSELRIPRAVAGSRPFDTMSRLTHRLIASRGTDEDAHAELQATAARLYGLDREEFARVLDTFPLVVEARRRAALRVFEALV